MKNWDTTDASKWELKRDAAQIQYENKHDEMGQKV